MLILIYSDSLSQQCPSIFPRKGEVWVRVRICLVNINISELQEWFPTRPSNITGILQERLCYKLSKNIKHVFAGHSHAPSNFIYLLMTHWLFLIKITVNVKDSLSDHPLRDSSRLLSVHKTIIRYAPYSLIQSSRGNSFSIPISHMTC